MHRQAVITLEFDVEDCREEKARERQLRALIETVGPSFKQVELKVIEKRVRKTSRAPTPAKTYQPPSAPMSALVVGVDANLRSD